ncbi:hypothetical protein LMH87_000443 [Akanthomyces muscarius]|uniref:F-box domain protein n=1 Tax=Akanthomyces muscarius TaxID=2231603 RepID=A0A9W8QFB9_AKAMU|nr:hypothetical protein LMH87_000443 [Akanthomyces muscarius]KAJ4155186.1 hypothetical protein LMH87_000443 [Akanthomyces muscarius]
MQVGLLSLSTELLTLIVAASAATADVDPYTGVTRATILGSLRLTCSRLSAAATPLLFRSIRLRPADDSIAGWHALLDGPSSSDLRSLVRRAVFESEFERQDHCTIWTGGGEAELTDLTDEWHAAVARLGEFANVDEVYVRFSPQCGLDDAGHEDYDDAAWYYDFRGSDTMEQRREILTAVFEAMADLPKGRRIRSLSVENLQNVVDKRFTNKPCFGEVLTGLEKLHVSVATEVDEASPENGLSMPAIVKFWPAFTDTWLRPAAPSLAALTLYCDNYFGAVPFWQGGGGGGGGGADPDSDAAHRLVFPYLRALALGNYVLGYESQLDWLASPTTFPRLERLALDDCPIMSHLLVYTALPRHLPPVYPERLHLIKTDPDASEERRKLMLASRLRWDAVFDRLREGLPSLKTFVFTRGAWQNGKAFSQRNYNVSRFLARRYLGYHEGIGPSQFLEPDVHPDEVEGPVKHYYDAYRQKDYRDTIDDDELGLEPPSSDPEVYKAELGAFNKLNEALAQRR